MRWLITIGISWLTCFPEHFGQLWIPEPRVEAKKYRMLQEVAKARTRGGRKEFRTQILLKMKTKFGSSSEAD